MTVLGEQAYGGGRAGAGVCGEPLRKSGERCRLFARRTRLSAETVRKERSTL